MRIIHHLVKLRSLKKSSLILKYPIFVVITEPSQVDHLPLPTARMIVVRIKQVRSKDIAKASLQQLNYVSHYY